MNVKAEIDKVDLVEYLEKFTELTKQGNQYRGVCPICQHGNPSEFVVYEHKTFHCWVCHSSGDLVNFVRLKYDLDFFGAVEKIADDLNIDFKADTQYVERKRQSLQFQDMMKQCHRNLNPVREYLTKKRGLNEETIEKYQLGANETGDVVIPFIDENGRNVGVAVRRFEGSPRYFTNKNNDLFTKSEFLFNYRFAKEHLTNELYLVEGFFDAMSMQQNRLASVAYNSSQPTKQQLTKIAKLQTSYPELTAILIPDNDGVAYPLLTRVRKNILKYAPDVAFSVVILPEGIKDASDYFLEHDREEFLQLPKKSLDMFVLEYEISKCSTIDAEKKVAEKFAKTVRDNLSLIEIARMLSNRWNISENAIREFLKISQTDERLSEDFKNPFDCVLETRAMLLEKNLRYGIKVLDENINGLGRKRDVTFVGASSGVGKTYLTLQICLNMVREQKKNAIYFSMEMSAGALYERIISNLLGKSTYEVDRLIREGDPIVERTLDEISERLYVVDKNGLSIEQLSAYVKEANAKIFDGELDAIFIDYIQYMRGCSEYAALAETAKGMKPLAKENNIHVVVLSQLNRGMNSYDRPSVAGLKGGGDLEASADNIFLLWRPGFNPTLSPQEKNELRNVIMLGVGKARSGSRIDEVKLEFNASTSQIVAR